MQRIENCDLEDIVGESKGYVAASLNTDNKNVMELERAQNSVRNARI